MYISTHIIKSSWFKRSLCHTDYLGEGGWFYPVAIGPAEIQDMKPEAEAEAEEVEVEFQGGWNTPFLPQKGRPFVTGWNSG